MCTCRRTPAVSLFFTIYAAPVLFVSLCFAVLLCASQGRYGVKSGVGSPSITSSPSCKWEHGVAISMVQVRLQVPRLITWRDGQSLSVQWQRCCIISQSGLAHSSLMMGTDTSHKSAFHSGSTGTSRNFSECCILGTDIYWSWSWPVLRNGFPMQYRTIPQTTGLYISKVCFHHTGKSIIRGGPISNSRCYISLHTSCADTFASSDGGVQI